MEPRGRSILVIVAVAIAALASSPAQSSAVPVVEPGDNPDAVVYGGVRYRSFASGASAEIYEGTDIDPFPADMVQQDLTWARPGSNSVLLSFDPSTRRLMTQVNDNPPLVYRGFDAGPVNYLRIAVQDHDGSGALQFANVAVDGVLLGSFASATPAPSPGCVTVSPNFPYGSCSWSVLGLDLDRGFTLRASIVLSRLFSACPECARVEVRLGYVPPVDAEGPDASEPSLSPAVTRTGSDVIVSASVDDRARGGSVIGGAELSVGGGPWVAMRSWDGTFDAPVERVVAATAAPAQPDLYDVCIRGMDVHGNRGRPVCGTLAAFDPGAGFLTAGGWFEAGAGALAADPSIAGRATFGVNSRYAKDAQVPGGSVEFQLHGGALNFHGSTQDWLLVMAGGRARLRAQGTVNGLPGFALEASLTGDAGQTIRVRIWELATGAAVFDNGAEQPLGGGSITVHAAKR